MSRRVVVTGMAVNTALGDELERFYESLLAGESAITRWRELDLPGVHSKLGGDLSGYSVQDKLQRLAERLDPETHTRARRLCKKAPFSAQLSVLCACDASLDAGLPAGLDPERAAVVVGGHNLNERYIIGVHDTYLEEPEFVPPTSAFLMLDTDHASSVGEALGWRGAISTLGGACASGNLALRAAVDEVRHHEHDLALVVGAALDFSPVGLQAMALLGAISVESFNETPAAASRPYDQRREGFVPAHGTAALVLEELEHARRRGARIYAEVLGCVANSAGSHLPSPDLDSQAKTMELVLRRAGVAPEEVDFVSAHATSTPLGDLTELQAIERAFGEHAQRLKINAPKSMLGHCCWSAPTVETVAAILQLRGGRLHPSINVEALDPEVRLDVCAEGPVELDARIVLKNSFGFGGVNCCALLRRWDEGGAP